MSHVLSRLTTDEIRFHGETSWGVGRMDWGTGREVLAYLDQTLQPGWHTVETGAGKSTVLFAAKQCFHTAITPSTEEIDRIVAYCQSAGVSLSCVSLMREGSEQALPILKGEYDLALIDGNHAFPWPFVDFLYLSRALRQDGLLIVDDAGIWSCGQLARFLMVSREWCLTRRLAQAGALVFKKLVPLLTDEWMRQPFPYVPPAHRRFRLAVGRLLRRLRLRR